MIGVVSPVPLNAKSPMLVTELGIVTEVKFTQSQKAPSPMLETELGIETDVKLSQSSKAPPMIVVIFSGIS